jgi:glucose/arabinose dehydrogenase
MFLDADGNVTFATPVLANGVRLRSAVEGPDGNLYISTDVGGGNGAIWRVVPS